MFLANIFVPIFRASKMTNRNMQVLFYEIQVDSEWWTDISKGLVQIVILYSGEETSGVQV